MKTPRALLPVATTVVAFTPGGGARGAEDTRATLSPEVLQEIAQVEADIDRIEAQAIERLAAPPDNQVSADRVAG